MRGLTILRGALGSRFLGAGFHALGLLWLRLLSLGLVAIGLATVGAGAVAALPLSEFDRVYPYLLRQAQICLMTSIPTQADPVRDEDILATMRQRLPDSFRCGRCRYDLAGDPGATYYLKTCR